MNLRDKTKEELVNELQELQKAHHSLQESYNRHVSESKKLEISLRLSEEKFRLVFENTSEAILFTQPDGAIQFANQEACRIFGFSNDEFQANGRNSVVNLNDSRLPEALEERKRTGKFKGELTFVRKDGTIFPGELTSNIYVDSLGIQRTSIIVRDETNRNLADEKLRKSEANYMLLSKQFEAILDHIPGLIFYKDTKNNFMRVNKYLAQLHGKSKEELEGKNLSDLYPKEDADNYYQDDLAVINSGLARMNIIEPLETKNGVKWVSTSKIPFVNTNGETIGVIGMSIDITERKLAEQKIELKNEELEKSNAVKDKFLSIIAHDLKSPFNSIVGYCDLLVERVQEEDYDGIGKFAEIISQSSHRAVNLLMNLMEWAQSQTGRMEFNPEHFEMKSLINEMEFLFEDIAIQKNIILNKVLPITSPVFADKAMIGTVLRNLIANAIKFTEPGGKIMISAEVKRNGLTVSVADSGIGIPKNRIETLFSIDESYSTPGTNNEKGTGLGLILCKEFIEKHGGRIWVESNRDGSSGKKGTSFHFTIPTN
ncbi:MAG: hypothetical protein CO098_03185 [Bacteroidetes bacterium CG_4_9_14_3_um_filter_41_19]|nr:MAG: hypothetical protein CO098_03185 [Bacteroidetes bacterium CG_4_9_14_3_um_filter_41_19]